MLDICVKKWFWLQEWFDNLNNLGMIVLYIECYLNQQYICEELQFECLIIGIVQIGSDFVFCNKIYIFLMDCIKVGICDGGGILMEFLVYLIQEIGKCFMVVLDCNFVYLGLVEVLYGYLLDGVVLMIGCDKIMFVMLMGVVMMDILVIMLNGGLMLDGWWKGKCVGFGMVIWESCRLLFEGKIDYEEFMGWVCVLVLFLGYCNIMGMVSMMNVMVEVLGMLLIGCLVIFVLFCEWMNMVYEIGKCIVQMVLDDLKFSDIMICEVFENVIIVNVVIGGLINVLLYLQVIVCYVGVELDVIDWQKVGFDVLLLLNMQFVGEFLGESFFYVGGVFVIMGELKKVGCLYDGVMIVFGKMMGENFVGWESCDLVVIKICDQFLCQNVGFIVLLGNLFDSVLMKISVIFEDFCKCFLLKLGVEGIYEVCVIVFEGFEDYYDCLNDLVLDIDENCILFICGVGCVGYFGSVEVVNMQLLDVLLCVGINYLFMVGDGWQLGILESLLILNVLLELVVGGGLVYLQIGDWVWFDLNVVWLDVLVDDVEWQVCKVVWVVLELVNQILWEEIYCKEVGQLVQGGCLELVMVYQKICWMLLCDNY